MATTHALAAEQRDKLGTRHCRRLREKGKLPAVLYGHKKGSVHLTLDAKDAITHIESGEKLFELSIADGDAQTALLKDIAFDYMGTRIVHLDFERVDLDELVTVNILMRFKGDAVGLKTAGAILMHPTTEITVQCAVKDLQDSLDVDISSVDVGAALHAGGVELPAGWKLLTDPDSVLAGIQITKKEAEGEEVEAVGEAGEGAPEIIGEKKEEESKE